MRYQFAALICFAVVFGFAYDGFAAVVLDESVGGDVSNDPQSPTLLNLALGTNSFIATMPGTDLDFITVNVPAGGQLSALIMAGYSGIDEVSFVAIGAGSQLPASILSYDPTGLLGYSHFGPQNFDIGEDMLPTLGAGDFGVPGFSIPLPSGNYTFWMQQESSVDNGYQLDFIVTAVPEPATAGLLLVAGAALLASVRVRLPEGVREMHTPSAPGSAGSLYLCLATCFQETPGRAGYSTDSGPNAFRPGGAEECSRGRKTPVRASQTMESRAAATEGEHRESPSPLRGLAALMRFDPRTASVATFLGPFGVDSR